VAVAEYRPNSQSIIYQVDPETMKAEEVFRFKVHIGELVRDTDDNSVHGVSWGSRRFYRWPLDANGKPTNADEAPEQLRRLNTSHYLDYQDCKYADDHRMLCSGVTEMRVTSDTPCSGSVALIWSASPTAALPDPRAVVDRVRFRHDP
jgi:Family of unknown function (DUF6454)